MEGATNLEILGPNFFLSVDLSPLAIPMKTIGFQQNSKILPAFLQLKTKSAYCHLTLPSTKKDGRKEGTHSRVAIFDLEYIQHWNVSTNGRLIDLSGNLSPDFWAELVEDSIAIADMAQEFGNEDTVCRLGPAGDSLA